jgi:hypothetical protein
MHPHRRTQFSPRLFIPNYLLSRQGKSADSEKYLADNNLIQVTERERPKRWSGQSLRPCRPAEGP